jgi:hypothetical protein
MRFHNEDAAIKRAKEMDKKTGKTFYVVYCPDDGAPPWAVCQYHEIETYYYGLRTYFDSSLR